MTTFPVTASTIATCASSATAGAVRAVVWAGTAAELLPVVLTAVRHAEDSEAAFLCRQVNAAEPLGLTFEQCALKSLRHAERSALASLWSTAEPRLSLVQTAERRQRVE